tara:strand:- start:225 stop:941 length:717 start_codon:yes stop_codon:yes gene_type:complete
MKFRNSAIGATLSLLSLGQPLIVGKGIAFTTFGVVIAVSQPVQANDALFYFRRGIEKFNARDFSEAISDYSRAIEINPTIGDIYYNRAIAKYHLKDYSGAISDYSKAIEINPIDALSYEHRGNAKVKLKNYSGAISDYSMAIENNPKEKDASLYYKRGIVRMRLKTYSEAITDFTNSILINPNDSKSYYRRGVALSINGNMIRACLDWRASIKIGYKKDTMGLAMAENVTQLIKDYCQ